MTDYGMLQWAITLLAGMLMGWAIRDGALRFGRERKAELRGIAIERRRSRGGPPHPVRDQTAEMLEDVTRRGSW